MGSFACELEFLRNEEIGIIKLKNVITEIINSMHGLRTD